MAYILKKLSKANLGWLFYMYYFNDPQPEDTTDESNNKGIDTLKNRNETILKRPFDPKDNKYFAIPDNSANIKFSFKIDYPGLLIGSGYTHEAIFDENNKPDAFKIGFFFDHISGIPCIPGHSIKGVLRSAFPHHNNEKYVSQKTALIIRYLEYDKSEKKRINDMKPYFEQYMNQCGISGVSYTTERFVELLGNLIFEGSEPYAFDENKFLYKQVSLYNKDIFYDAYILSGGKDNFFLGEDHITPHADPLKNPNPIKFLKILPQVQLQFQFQLSDKLISPTEKEELFKKILLDFGVGAKTNVGYGQFSVL